MIDSFGFVHIQFQGWSTFTCWVMRDINVGLWTVGWSEGLGKSICRICLFSYNVGIIHKLKLKIITFTWSKSLFFERLFKLNWFLKHYKNRIHMSIILENQANNLFCKPFFWTVIYNTWFSLTIIIVLYFQARLRTSLYFSKRAIQAIFPSSKTKTSSLLK